MVQLRDPPSKTLVCDLIIIKKADHRQRPLMFYEIIPPLTPEKKQ